ncbi:MAG: integrase [Rhizobiaceae bacterium]|nr:integrase [Rhizobiaceae bacterium]
MARKRSRKDPDRFLANRAGNYHYKRRVPVELASVDARAPVVRLSLKTDDLPLARRKRDQLEAADDALWASMLVHGETDPARRRYQAAVKRVEAMGFSFYSGEDIAAFDNYEDVRRRLLELEHRLGLDETPHPGPLIGAIDVPKTTISRAFDIYCDEIVADELVTKSQAQRDQWKKVKRRAVNNFIDLISDKPMEEITVEDAKKVYLHWLSRIAPKGGAAASASASSGNRDLGNLRVLYAAYFKHNGMLSRVNPFEGFSFSNRKKRSRPPIPTEWIRDTILKDATRLSRLNEEARGILLIMIETGARPSEIANLEPTSFRLSHKVPHISIEPRENPDDPREIKTESSRRLVPLMGVALAAAKRHRDGFPRYRNRENDLSAALNKFLRENKLFPTAGHTVYSFRHSFEDRMKDGGLEDELRRLIMGHTVDRPKYGQGGSLEWRLSELKKIELPFDPTIV